MVPLELAAKSYSPSSTLDVDPPKAPECRCPRAGPLHRAVYGRKPRGGPADLPEAVAVRLSFCCGREGCRRRVLPPSVLFWGRRVYWGGVVLVLTALREGRVAGVTVERLRARFGVTRPTLTRGCATPRRLPPDPDVAPAGGRLWPPVPGAMVADLPPASSGRGTRPGSSPARGPRRRPVIAVAEGGAPGWVHPAEDGASRRAWARVVVGPGGATADTSRGGRCGGPEEAHHG
jgi:hypothetical protein